MKPRGTQKIRLRKRLSTLRFIATSLIALGSISTFSTAQAQSCPCNFFEFTREINRGFVACGSQQFHAPGVDWDGVRRITIFKGWKGGREPGSATAVVGIVDYANVEGDPVVGPHFCEVASGLRKNGGTYRRVNRQALSSIDDWDACLEDLAEVAAMGQDYYSTCGDSDNGIPDVWEELLDKPPLPSAD